MSRHTVEIPGEIPGFHIVTALYRATAGRMQAGCPAVTSSMVIALSIAAAVGVFVKPAWSHDPYSDWVAPDNPGLSCCNGADCRPTRAFLANDGLWRAWNGRTWLPVPPGRVLPTDYAGDGRSHLCEKLEVIYCFTPSEPKG